MAQMTQKETAQVSINPATLNALVALVCDKEGVNLSPIIDDLSNGLDEHRAVIAANTVLAFKGVTVEVDTATRYFAGGPDNYKMYEFVTYSTILDRVTYHATYFRLREGNWEITNSYEESCSYESWLSKKTECPVSTSES